MPIPGKKTLSAAALALAASLGIVAGHVLKAQAEATTSVTTFEVRADIMETYAMTAFAETCMTPEGRDRVCSGETFRVPMTPALLDALGSVRDAAQAVYEAKQAAVPPKE